MTQRFFIICFLMLATWSWSQDTQGQIEAEIKAAEDRALERKRQVENYEQALVDKIEARWLDRDQKAQEEMDKKVSEEILIRIKRGLFVKEYLDLIHPKEKNGDIKVALLGNSARFFETTGYHIEVLEKLLASIKQHQPNAVFFMGNLVYGLKIAEQQSEQFVQLPVEKNIFGKTIERIAGYYDKEVYQRQQESFLNTVQEILGKDIPFYPLAAEHEVIGPGALDAFRERFPVNGSQVIDSKEMVYSVQMGNALFLVLSSDFYDAAKNQVVENKIIPGVFDWLTQQLKEEGSKSRFIFVVGNSPAFSTESTFGIFDGLDQNRNERDRFWNLLTKHQVLAYFASDEVLYDRSYRYGMWQLISGGAGATRDIIGEEDETFYHYLLLTIPQGRSGDPTIQVFDLEGKKRDEFVLTRQPGALFDLRIPNRISDQ